MNASHWITSLLSLARVELHSHERFLSQLRTRRVMSPPAPDFRPICLPPLSLWRKTFAGQKVLWPQALACSPISVALHVVPGQDIRVRSHHQGRARVRGHHVLRARAGRHASHRPFGSEMRPGDVAIRQTCFETPSSSGGQCHAALDAAQA